MRQVLVPMYPGLGLVGLGWLVAWWVNWLVGWSVGWLVGHVACGWLSQLKRVLYKGLVMQIARHW